MIDDFIQISCLQVLEWNILQKVKSFLILLNLSLEILKRLVQHVLELVSLLKGSWLLIFFLLENKEIIHVISVPAVRVLMCHIVVVEMICLLLWMVEVRKIGCAVMWLLQEFITLMIPIVIIIAMAMVVSIAIVHHLFLKAIPCMPP